MPAAQSSSRTTRFWRTATSRTAATGDGAPYAASFDALTQGRRAQTEHEQRCDDVQAPGQHDHPDHLLGTPCSCDGRPVTSSHNALAARIWTHSAREPIDGVGRGGEDLGSGAGGEGVPGVGCSSCGHDSRVGARFCEGCGTGLPQPCRACGEPLSVGAQFCGACGAAVASEPTVARKVVTVVFGDPAGGAVPQLRSARSRGQLVGVGAGRGPAQGGWRHHLRQDQPAPMVGRPADLQRDLRHHDQPVGQPAGAGRSHEARRRGTGAPVSVVRAESRIGHMSSSDW
jgi:hypothetical protein